MSPTSFDNKDKEKAHADLSNLLLNLHLIVNHPATQDLEAEKKKSVFTVY
jgi:hypothetical protein